MKRKSHDLNHDLNHDLTFYFNCVCHIISSMYRVLGIYNFVMLLNNAESADLLKTRAMLVSKTVNTLHHCLLFTCITFWYISHTENAKYFLGIKLFWIQLCFHQLLTIVIVKTNLHFTKFISINVYFLFDSINIFQKQNNNLPTS